MSFSEFEWSQHLSLLVLFGCLFFQSVKDGKRIAKLREELHDLEKRYLKEEGAIASAHHKLASTNLRINQLSQDVNRLKPPRITGYVSK